jgi:hypothetical protein
MKLQGTPEGVEIVRIGISSAQEFELVGGLIYKGGRNNSISHVVVRPLPGWSFELDEDLGGLVPVRPFPNPVDIVVTCRYRVNNSREKDTVYSGLDAMKRMPGFGTDGNTPFAIERPAETTPAAAEQSPEAAPAAPRPTAFDAMRGRRRPGAR